MKSVIFLVFSVILFAACKQHDEVKPTVENACDTAQVKYSTCIKPMLDTKCIGCHATGNTSGYVNLDNYNDVKLFGISGELYGCSAHLDGFVYMPPGGVKGIDSMGLVLIKKWVDQGFLP